ncbi:hypothetical protein PR048_012683 [Dryococelus australis]|uniref:Uncharacterized protein n=1 Tax=Dryococelus australis TaxID=614101 RepID=A0ABQ9HQ15_9NEOP|nr:hypothetical protein PR048_012683 [Dryococelus australis]
MADGFIELLATWTFATELCDDVSISRNVKGHVCAGKALGDSEWPLNEKNNLRLWNGTISYRYWQKPGVIRLTKLYIFNVTNPDGFLNGGEKPKCSEGKMKQRGNAGRRKRQFPEKTHRAGNWGTELYDLSSEEEAFHDSASVEEVCNDSSSDKMYNLNIDEEVSAHILPKKEPTTTKNGDVWMSTANGLPPMIMEDSRPVTSALEDYSSPLGLSPIPWIEYTNNSKPSVPEVLDFEEQETQEIVEDGRAFREEVAEDSRQNKIQRNMTYRLPRWSVHISDILATNMAAYWLPTLRNQSWRSRDWFDRAGSPDSKTAVEPPGATSLSPSPCIIIHLLLMHSCHSRRHERTACTKSPFRAIKHYDIGTMQFMQGDTLKEHIDICKGSCTGSQQVMSIPHATSVGTDSSGDNYEAVNDKDSLSADEIGGEDSHEDSINDNHYEDSVYEISDKKYYDSLDIPTHFTEFPSTSGVKKVEGVQGCSYFAATNKIEMALDAENNDYIPFCFYERRVACWWKEECACYVMLIIRFAAVRMVGSIANVIKRLEFSRLEIVVPGTICGRSARAPYLSRKHFRRPFTDKTAILKTSRASIISPASTLDYLRLPVTTYDYLRLLATTCDYPRLPATLRDYFRLHVTSCYYP